MRCVLHQQSKVPASLITAMDAMFVSRDELDVALDLSLLDECIQRRQRPVRHSR